MRFLGNVLRLLGIYSILNVQFSFYGASPLYGPSVRDTPEKELRFVVSLNHKDVLDKCRIPQSELDEEKAHVCSGALITRQHVLTASHCFKGKTRWYRFDEIFVKIGMVDLRDTRDNEIHGVACWKTYSQYNKPELGKKEYDDNKEGIFDIAVLKLLAPVEVNFPLPTLSFIPDDKLYGKTAVVSGWGKLEDMQKSRYLKSGKSRILNSDHCYVDAFSRIEYLVKLWKKTYLCTDPQSVRTRKGDSGGPLLYDGVNADYPNNIIGVTSGSCTREEPRRCNMHVPAKNS